MKKSRPEIKAEWGCPSRGGLAMGLAVWQPGDFHTRKRAGGYLRGELPAC